MAKVDMFSASKALSDRVAYFMNAKVAGAILKARYDDARIKSLAAIEGLENCKGSMLAEGKEDEFNASIKALNDKVEKLKDEYEKNREETAKFEYSECDKALYKAYKDGESISDALCKWARAYDLEIAGTDFLNDLITAVSGLKAQNAKGIIKSKAESFTKVRSRDDILKTMYGVYAEKMIKVGTLKACQIPEDVYNMYAPKTKKSEK